MDSGQRYCLECGARRAHLGGVREGLRTSTSPGGPLAGALSAAAASPPTYASVDAGAPAPASMSTRGSGATAVIAGVGVLLLAMGIGVLIGRAGSSSGKAAAAPQVISVAQPGTGTAGASGAGTGSATTPTTSTATHSAAPKQSKPSTSGVGAVPSKPAPPSALQNLRTGGSGQSYEQKSKNLPNVVSTG